MPDMCRALFFRRNGTMFVSTNISNVAINVIMCLLFLFFRRYLPIFVGMESNSGTPRNKPNGQQDAPDIKKELKRIFNVKVRNNRSVFVFLVIFVIILAIWFLKQVESGYVMSATISPVYVNAPAGYTSEDLSRQKIKIAVQMNGFNMLSYAVGTRDLEVDLNKVVRESHGRHYWIPARHPELVAQAILPSDQIKDIVADTIFLNMGDEVSKIVPVEVSKISTTFRPGYGAFDPVMISPVRVKIFGTPEEVGQIDRITLPELSYRNLSAPFTDSVRLTLPASLQKVRVEPSRVAVSLTVKPYTEGEMQVSVRAVNVPSGYSVKFFPAKVSLRYRVAVEDYARVGEKDFRVTVDMSHTDPDTRFVYPKITASPLFVGKMTLVPEKVQYIYRKR